MSLKTQAIPVTTTTKRHDRKRHIVELDGDGKPLDECLCGYLWDIYPLPHGKSICQECVDELRRRRDQ